MILNNFDIIFKRLKILKIIDEIEEILHTSLKFDYTLIKNYLLQFLY